MRPATLLWIVVGTGLLAAQSTPSNPIVRSITVRVVPTSSQGLVPFSMEAVTSAWKNGGVNFAVEKPLDVPAIDKAKEAIRDLYARDGHPVRVEHSITSIPPQGSIEVAFQVIELCTCQ